MTLSLDDGSASWLQGCERKFRFGSRGEAKRERKRRERRHTSTAKLYIYGCRHCGGWHLTSRPPDVADP